MPQNIALKKIFWWTALTLWMVVIYYFSSQPDLQSGLTTWIDLVLRKIAHMAEFGVLCYLWFQALGVSMPLTTRPKIFFALLFSVLYAATDEWHQSFVGGRHGSPVDVLVDAFGAAVLTGLLLKQHRNVS